MPLQREPLPPLQLKAPSNRLPPFLPLTKPPDTLVQLAPLHRMRSASSIAASESQRTVHVNVDRLRSLNRETAARRKRSQQRRERSLQEEEARRQQSLHQRKMARGAFHRYLEEGGCGRKKTAGATAASSTPQAHLLASAPASVAPKRRLGGEAINGSAAETPPPALGQRALLSPLDNRPMMVATAIQKKTAGKDKERVDKTCSSSSSGITDDLWPEYDVLDDSPDDPPAIVSPRTPPQCLAKPPHERRSLPRILPPLHVSTPSTVPTSGDLSMRPPSRTTAAQLDKSEKCGICVADKEKVMVQPAAVARGDTGSGPMHVLSDSSGFFELSSSSDDEREESRREDAPAAAAPAATQRQTTAKPPLPPVPPPPMMLSSCEDSIKKRCLLAPPAVRPPTSVITGMTFIPSPVCAIEDTAPSSPLITLPPPARQRFPHANATAGSNKAETIMPLAQAQAQAHAADDDPYMKALTAEERAIEAEVLRWDVKLMNRSGWKRGGGQPLEQRQETLGGGNEGSERDMDNTGEPVDGVGGQWVRPGYLEGPLQPLGETAADIESSLEASLRRLDRQLAALQAKHANDNTTTPARTRSLQPHRRLTPVPQTIAQQRHNDTIAIRPFPPSVPPCFARRSRHPITRLPPLNGGAKVVISSGTPTYAHNDSTASPVSAVTLPPIVGGGARWRGRTGVNGERGGCDGGYGYACSGRRGGAGVALDEGRVRVNREVKEMLFQCH
ncbi:unnamed protein product [Vitrella brassicaformis CCMP3155]|uniref:Uncharacterized protein n=3 Tax=Vitrella brassicaformis TaxID=1169539 RepID=A0A0G4ER68_VITBC|nr:unnamed protein product [Vitrella brassicaformis CCMP3155]|eukprot:CEL99756.1 unnamed protein product [Vitrella brassicaformis CCMP3155]